MPLITCEMRWFLDGPLPDVAERWFRTGVRPVPATWREDRYLILSGAADMGIKKREGRLEIKGRIAKLGSHAVAPGIEGNAERWCKWSYEASALAAGLRCCLDGEGTVVVGKGRLQRQFLLHPGGAVEETAQRDLARRGLSMELTRIRLGGEEHWSLGLEAGPDDATLLPDLLVALRDVLSGFPVSLPRKRSRSYPRWLLELRSACHPDR